MMSSEVTTPIKTRAGRKVASYAAKSIAKDTILTFDNNSYLEDEDSTYIHAETSSISEPSDSESIVEVTEESDLDLKEKPSESDNSTHIETKTETSKETENQATTPPPKFRQLITKHEIPRKLFHSSIGAITLYLYSIGVHQTQIILPVTTLFVIIFVNDFVRFRNAEYNESVVKFWWWVIRENEFETYNGILWYLLGLFIVFSLYPKDISVLSVLFLSWADTAASTFGRLYGKFTPQIGKGKSLAGCIASFVTGMLACYLLYGYYIPTYGPQVDTSGDIIWTAETSRLNLHVFAILSGAFASVSELINLFGWDDNLTIPVLSSALVFSTVKLFQL